MGHLPPAIARVRTALRDFLRERRRSGELDDGDLLLVACSGGADSLALAAQLAFLAPRHGLRGGLATVDHRMQQGSAAQAERVADLGRELGLDPVLVAAAPASRAAPPAAALGPEGQARQVRYAALTRAAAETGARAVLVGHTMEDQAETVLLGLLRGSGTRTIAGMAPVRGGIWRPLLTVRRADTEAACAALNLPAWQDPTNAPDGPWRTAEGGPLPRAALRHHVLPEIRTALDFDPVPALARTAALARADADHLQAEAGALLHLLTRDEAGHLGAAVAEMGALPPALRWRLLRELLVRAGAPKQDTTMSHVLAVDALLTDWRGQHGISVPGGLRARRAYGRIYVAPHPPMETP